VSECPFCGGEVSEQMLKLGGTCPHCFAVIPGDETATDPGEDVRRAQENEDRRRATFRSLIPLLLVVPIVAAAAGASIWVFLQPEPELVVLDLDDEGVYTFPFDALADADEAPTEPEVPATPHPKTGKSGSTSTERKTAEVRPRRPNLGQVGDQGLPAISLPTPSDGSLNDGVAEATRDRASDVLPTELGSGLTIGMSSQPSASSASSAVGRVQVEAPPLVNDQEIMDMIRKQVGRYLGRLKVCHDQALNSRPDLSGAWKVVATVQTDGSVSDVSVLGQDGVSDPVLEECAVRQVERWRFQRIARPTNFGRTIQFRGR
jgi:hypothetical protein